MVVDRASSRRSYAPRHALLIDLGRQGVECSLGTCFCDSTLHDCERASVDPVISRGRSPLADHQQRRIAMIAPGADQSPELDATETDGRRYTGGVGGGRRFERQVSPDGFDAASGFGHAQWINA